MSSSSSSNSDDSTSSSNDEDILEDMNRNDFVLFQMMATMASNTTDLFNSHGMEGGGRGGGGGVEYMARLLVSMILWVQCEPHQHYLRL
jgi:hypothetical protein